MEATLLKKFAIPFEPSLGEPSLRKFAFPTMAKLPIPFLAFGLFVPAACSSPDAGPATDAGDSSIVDHSATPSTSSPPPAKSMTATPAVSDTTLTLDGLGDLVIGKAVASSSSFKLRGAQASDSCLVYTSPNARGVYAIVEDGKVRRVTVAGESPIKLEEGIGVGSAEKAVLAAFPGFTSEAHKYVSPPGKYLTQPGNDPRLRFEIGEDGKVTAIHVGIKPQLQYVEGCA